MASSSRWRRRSPADKAINTGRQWSVGGSTPLCATRYSTRSLARCGRAGRRSPPAWSRGSPRASPCPCPPPRGRAGCPVRRGQAGHRRVDEARLLLAEQLVLGPRLLPVRVREQVGVAPGPLLALHERRDQIAGRGDRVRDERLVLDARPRRHDPGQGLLHEVVTRRRIGDPGRNHPADDRDEVDDRLFRRGGGLRHVHAHPSRGFGGLVTPSGLVETPNVSPTGDRPPGP